jgi:indolepyruvate ferredoxin oxidoreductase
MATDPRFLVESGPEVFTGNELLVKGALEAEGGVHLLTGYPGSPVAGFFDVFGDLKALLNAKGVRAFQANNEALAVAAVNGAQMLPCRASASMSRPMPWPSAISAARTRKGRP